MGGGLVGRIAAWAVMQAGHCPVIYDRMQEAKAPKGFTYLHSEIQLPLKKQMIVVINQGNKEEYANKIYLDPKIKTSFGKYDVEFGYDPAEALNILNGLQHKMVIDRGFENWDEVFEVIQNGDYQKAIFTLPLNKFFKGRYTYIRGSIGVWKLNEGEVLENFCVYNSNPDIPWVRSGNMFGYAFREFPNALTDHIPIIKVMEGDKPPEMHNVLFTGRFGKWDKSALSDDTYYEVREWLK